MSSLESNPRAGPPRQRQDFRAIQFTIYDANALYGEQRPTRPPP